MEPLPTTENINQQNQQDQPSPIPAVNLPKGGGAIGGIGEKFQVNSISGTASLNIPIHTGSGRSGFVPGLSLSYDSGNGNGPFGYGWHLGVANISRKTSKGIPQYHDETDTFLLSGAEDLVPYLEQQGSAWIPMEREEGDYHITNHRPRLEGLFSKIEKWENKITGITHWKTISKNNIISLYGKSEDTRIYDPEDEKRVFQWLLEKSFDAKGNIICYQYKHENVDGIDATYSYEGSRIKEKKAFNHVYLKTVLYGNKQPNEEEEFHFSVVFDFGEHDEVNPSAEEIQPWLVRQDPFSRFNSGFELRQYRLCKRILIFHDFPELGEKPALVRATTLSYSATDKASILTSVQQNGYKSKPDNSLEIKSFPPLTFSYSESKIGNEVKTIAPEYLDNLPYGVDGATYQWLDLEGEALPGIFTETAGGWYYKNNRGEATFSDIHLLSEKPHPSVGSSNQPVLSDIDVDGTKELIINGTFMSGYVEQKDNRWQHFMPFEEYPSIDTVNPNLKYIDLNGDGLADILISEDEVFTWYPSKGKKGFGPPEYMRKSFEEESGPALVFSNPEQSLYLADMTGDGLNDILRICNGEIVYWPNHGYGKFGAKVTMENAPFLDTPDLFNQSRIRLFDVDGTGTTDLIYFREDIVNIWYNQSGNSWSQRTEINSFPTIDNFSTLAVVDLLGKGTGCLVWSSPLPGDRGSQIRYIDLMDDGKPYLMTSINNNMGSETLLSYTSSTTFYLDDLKSGNPWITKLHFPVQVLKQVTVLDHVSSSNLVTSYKYHHGYYDGEEREFRGFGMVEQTDSESFDTYLSDNALDMPPIYTKSWFHTGVYIRRGVISQQYAGEYYDGDSLAHEMPDSVIDEAGNMDFNHLREAYRALKGKLLRQEIYTLDGTDKEGIPYSVTETNFNVQLLQPVEAQKFGVNLTLASESLTYAYERHSEDPRIAHSMLLETDEFGQPLKTIEVGYPRRSTAGDAYVEQQQLNVTAQTNTYFNEVKNFYLLGVVLEQKNYEVNSLILAADAYFHIDDLESQLKNVFDDDVILDHHEPFASGVQARLLSWTKNYFRKDESDTLPFGEVSSLALPHHSEQIMMSSAWVNDVYGTKIDDKMMVEAGYLKQDNHWWNPGTTIYYLDGSSFYLPFKTLDAFGNTSRVYYDDHFLIAVNSEDTLGNTISAEIDYRTISPRMIIDINDNVSEVLTDPLGMVIATSIYGTVDGRSKGDALLSLYEEQTNFTIYDVIANPTAYLQEATSFFYYNLEAWMNDKQPLHFINLLREKHVSELDGEEALIHVNLAYSDGFGRTLQQKIKVDDDETGGEQWLVTGRTIYNNKEKPVKQYEPFFSDTFTYQDEAEVAPVGVTPIIYYDPLGRVIKTVTPKGFYSEVLFDAWQVSAYDENDTVKDSLYYKEHIGSNDVEEVEALRKAEVHYNSPSVVILDSMARQFMTLQYQEEAGLPLITLTTFDIRGNPLTITDPRQYASNQSRSGSDQVNNFEYMYDLAGNILFTDSIDAGKNWTLINVQGNPVQTWNGLDYHIQTDYDELQRPVKKQVAGNGLDQIIQLMEYGEKEADALDKNLRGQLVRHYDQAGLVENLLFDINGQSLQSRRTMREDYKAEVSWNDIASTAMETESFTATLEYDTLGRIIKSFQPDGSITRPTYYQSGWLKKVEVQLKQETDFTPIVQSIEYDARGQRTKIIYGNNVHTRYVYEETTFRLINLKTTRQEEEGSLTLLQDISYVYDPVGNIVKITDNSHEKVFTANQGVNAESAFVYDALYQLKEATGREHLALSKTDYQQESDVFKAIHLANINDSNQLRNYTRQYTYDDAGNLTRVKHIGENAFTRNITVSDVSNRSITDEMDHNIPVESYFDAAGNMKELEHLQGIEWNYRNNIASVTIIERDSENDSEYYVYDASGQRIRKVNETYNINGDLLWKEEKIYLGGVALKRKYQGSSETLIEDRSTLHIMDDRQRIAIVYYWGVSNDSSVTIEKNKIHYQLGNHLGSATMELDASGQLISYEEYFPFGGTAFTAGSNAAEVALKEYRYTGKERDDTTGLYYYGARYYAPWMGRWLNPDPAGTVDGLNVYRYVRNNPLRLVDNNGLDSEETYNAGEQSGFRRIDGIVYAEYQAIEDTWISASALEQGWNEYFPKDLAYGAYAGIVLDTEGNQWQNTDLVKPGERYLIPVTNQEDFITEPPIPTEEPSDGGSWTDLLPDSIGVNFDFSIDIGGAYILGGTYSKIPVGVSVQAPTKGPYRWQPIILSTDGQGLEGVVGGGGGLSFNVSGGPQLSYSSADNEDITPESFSGESTGHSVGAEGAALGKAEFNLGGYQSDPDAKGNTWTGAGPVASVGIGAAASGQVEYQRSRTEAFVAGEYTPTDEMSWYEFLVTSKLRATKYFFTSPAYNPNLFKPE